jgi:outer membrane protein assembly factor BamB
VLAVKRKTGSRLWKAPDPHLCELLLAGDVLFVGGRDEVTAYRPGDGKVLWRHPVQGRAYGLVHANGRLLVSTDEGVLHCFVHDAAAPTNVPGTQDSPRSVKDPRRLKTPTLRLAEGPVLRFLTADKAVIRWQTSTPTPTLLEFSEGQDARLLKDNTPRTAHEVTLTELRKDRLYHYRIHAFVDGQDRMTEPFECDTYLNFTAVPQLPAKRPFAVSEAARSAAKEILGATVARQGICLVLGLNDGHLVHELASSTSFHIIAVDDDTGRVERLGDLFRQAGLYGSRVSILHVARLEEAPLPACFANLVVSERCLSGDLPPLPAAQLYCYVRPSGGTALVGPLPRPRLEEWLGKLDVPAQWRTAGGSWLQLTRAHLPDAGVWSHQYGLPDNSAFAGETLGGAKSAADLEVLWFGQPGPRFQGDRNPRKPAPLAVNGRLFVQGFGRILGMDGFNGTILWSLDVPHMKRFNVLRDCSNWCADDDRLYLAVEHQCWQLDAANGHITARLGLAEALPGEDVKDADWGYVARVDKWLLGTTVKADSNYTDYWGGLNWYDAKAGPNNRLVCADRLFAVPLGDKAARWTYRGGAIIHPTVTIAGGHVFFVESRSAALGKNLSGRISDELWKDLHLVAVALETGKVAWSRPIAPLPGFAAFYLAHGSGTLVLVSSEKNRYGIYAFRPEDGKPLWDRTLKWAGGDHGLHLSRPVIVGKRLIVRPWLIDLATGKESATPVPRGGCGTYCATANLLVFRAGEVTLWDWDANVTTRWARLRPDCWLSTVPACGLLLSPEGGGGCSCGGWMEMSVGFLPRGFSGAAKAD